MPALSSLRHGARGRHTRTLGSRQPNDPLPGLPHTLASRCAPGGAHALGARTRAHPELGRRWRVGTTPVRPTGAPAACAPTHPLGSDGKIERFHRTLAEGWAFKKFYASEHTRRKALPGWLHEYNHHRPHTAIGKVSPITRLTNLSGQYT